MNLIDAFHQTNNQSDKELYHKYISNFYSEKFEKFKDKKINILEIGIQYGNSLKLWEHFFKNAKIYAIDISQYYIHEYGENVKIIIGNAYNNEILDYFKSNNILFDIIIDDGPHTLETQDFFLQNYQQLLKPSESIIILEDIYNHSFDHLKNKYSDFSIIDLTDVIKGENNSRIMYKETL
jgi:SAM-dependent methyltransferase